jgi:cytochrome P450
MEYLDKVISESLRLYPPVVSFVVRRVGEDITLGQYKIPEGMNIQIPVWQIHHDPNLWPKPYQFDPERFDRTQKKSRHPMAYIPFGAGPRNCIGAKFAMTETKLTLARIIRKFRYAYSDIILVVKLENRIEFCLS